MKGNPQQAVQRTNAEPPGGKWLSWISNSHLSKSVFQRNERFEDENWHCVHSGWENEETTITVLVKKGLINSTLCKWRSSSWLKVFQTKGRLKTKPQSSAHILNANFLHIFFCFSSHIKGSLKSASKDHPPKRQGWRTWIDKVIHRTEIQMSSNTGK